MKKSEKKLLEKINGLNVEKKPLDLSKINIEPSDEKTEKKKFNFNFLIPLTISCLLVMVLMSIKLNETGPQSEKPDLPSSPSTEASGVKSLNEYFEKNYEKDYSFSALSFEMKVSKELIKIYEQATNEQSDEAINKSQCKLFIELLKESIDNGTLSVGDLLLNEGNLGDGEAPGVPSVGPNHSTKPDIQISLYESMMKEIDEYLK